MEYLLLALIGRALAFLISSTPDVISALVKLVPDWESLPGVPEAIEALRGEPSQEKLCAVSKALEENGKDGQLVTAALLNSVKDAETLTPHPVTGISVSEAVV